VVRLANANRCPFLLEPSLICVLRMPHNSLAGLFAQSSYYCLPHSTPAADAARLRGRCLNGSRLDSAPESAQCFGKLWSNGESWPKTAVYTGPRKTGAGRLIPSWLFVKFTRRFRSGIQSRAAERIAHNGAAGTKKRKRLNTQPAKPIRVPEKHSDFEDGEATVGP
jgi:hypothetical protein